MSRKKIFIFGLDRAGKTVISTYLTKGTIDKDTRPSLGFNQSLLIHPKLELSLMDTPGQAKLRKGWIKHIEDSACLVYVVDTSDDARFPESKKELTDFIGKLLNFDAPMIIVFNKMDLPEAKERLKKAKEIFALDQFYIQKVYPMECTYADTKTLDALREKIYELINKFEVEEKARKAEQDKISEERKQELKRQEELKKQELKKQEEAKKF